MAASLVQRPVSRNPRQGRHDHKISQSPLLFRTLHNTLFLRTCDNEFVGHTILDELLFLDRLAQRLAEFVKLRPSADRQQQDLSRRNSGNSSQLALPAALLIELRSGIA